MRGKYRRHCELGRSRLLATSPESEAIHLPKLVQIRRWIASSCLCEVRNSDEVGNSRCADFVKPLLAMTVPSLLHVELAALFHEFRALLRHAFLRRDLLIRQP